MRNIKGPVNLPVNQGWDGPADSMEGQLLGLEKLDSWYIKISHRNVFTNTCKGMQWLFLGTLKGLSHLKREIGVEMSKGHTHEEK